MPSLGVPVSFAEINTVSVICELTLMHEGVIPDVSLGTHFFNDLVEMDILYLAIIPGKNGDSMNEQFLRERPVVSLVTAFSVGFVAAKLFGRRR